MYDSVVTLSTNNQKLSERLSKGFERLVYWNEYIKRGMIKIQQVTICIFLIQTFFGVNRLLDLFKPRLQ